MSQFKRLILHPSFERTISAVKDLKVTLPTISSVDLEMSSYDSLISSDVLKEIEPIDKYTLDPNEGVSFLNKTKYNICAYDESIQKFKALEGTAYLTSHTLIMHEEDYLASSYLTFYFYTRSKELCEKSEYIKYSESVETDFKSDYSLDRSQLLENNTPKNTILFIDGPLIGGQISNYTIRTNLKLLDDNILPIFFVKNSDSNLVVNHISKIHSSYNSDLHWAHSFLKKGERTNFFEYQDVQNKNNTKIFCYLKAFENSPQRVEFHPHTFRLIQTSFPNIMDMIYYLLLVQGNLHNSQLRPIAIAEKYARETIKLYDLIKIMKDLGITPIINEERFGG